jgi:hypothetical protein
MNYKILISSSYFTASQNGTTRQTDESWCLRRFCIQFSEICLLANGNWYLVDSNTFFFSVVKPYIHIISFPTLTSVDLHSNM